MASDNEPDFLEQRPDVDTKVAAAAKKLADAQPEPNSDGENDGEDLDDLLDDLDKDDDFDFGSLREQRMKELKQEVSKMKVMQEGSHGRYTDLTDEKQVIETSASEDRCVIHFAHRDFRRCQIMDQHLEKIAPKYFKTRFIRVYVENVPWLVDKLQIKVLPCVIAFVRGKVTHKFVGFEEMGNDDNFQTSLLEMQLSLTGVLDDAKKVQPQKSYTQSSKIRQGTHGNDEDDFEYDL